MCPQRTKVCPICGIEFVPSHPSVTCCSNKCGARLRNGPVPADPPCPVCGKPIKRQYKRQRWSKTCSHECAAKLRTQDERERFWRFVDKSGGPNACWPWIGGSKSSGGYGIFNFVRDGEKHSMSAHRYALIEAIGPIPDDVFACHDCPEGDNPKCCNPAHLFPGTPRENTQDMISKGRMNIANKPRGERNHNAKLTAEKVRAIRTAHANGTTAYRLARDYDVSEPTIAAIVHRETWRHVTDS